jgi:hypothetical protein
MTDRLTPARLAEIRQRAAHATEGPWAIWRDLDHQGFITVGDATGVIPEGAAYTEGPSNPTAHVYIEEDAEFIAAARADVPDLLAEIERLTAEHAAFEQRLADVQAEHHERALGLNDGDDATAVA